MKALESIYAHPIGRAIMRALRVAGAGALSIFIGELIDAPEIIELGLSVFFVALDKYLRDREIY